MRNFCFYIFIFFTVGFSQSISFEEELMLFGAQDFFLDDKPPIDDTHNKIPQIQQDGTVRTDGQIVESESGDSVKNTGQNIEKTRRQTSSAISSASMLIGQGSARTASAAIDTTISDCRNIDGKEVCDTTFSFNAFAEKISAFDTASVALESSIDFSRNLSEYRSPQKALFYSLLLPGLGQAYNKKYWRTGLYVAIEIGMITGAVHFRKDAKKIRANAEKFADSHFKEDKLENFYEALHKYVDKNEDKFPQPDNEDEVKNIGKLIFGESSGFYDGYDDEEAKTNYREGYKRYLDEFRNDRYGERYGVGSNYGVQGWDDAKPGYSLDYPDFYLGNYEIDTTYLHILIDGKSVFGVSQNQKYYKSEINYSVKQERRSSVFIVGIFANHIASAMDAFVSAIIHNRKLLKEENGKSTKTEDILSGISIESDMYFDVGNNLTSKLGLVWRF